MLHRFLAEKRLSSLPSATFLFFVPEQVTDRKSSNDHREAMVVARIPAAYYFNITLIIGKTPRRSSATSVRQSAPDSIK